LSERGKIQAARLGDFFAAQGLSAVYSSPARRARLTAEAMSRGLVPVKVCDTLQEIDMGDWEGLSFAEIRERYPGLYERRGKNPGTVVPPNAEAPAHAQARAASALERILGESAGAIALAGHAGINRLLLCAYGNRGLDEWLSLPQPYGCVNILREGEGGLRVEETGRMPDAAPAEEDCLALLCEKGTPPPVIAHCRAVAKKAEEIARALARRGFALDGGLIHAGALLHDIARACAEHARTGAGWLRQQGYPAVADIIAGHEDLGEAPKIDEAAFVCLADKLILGTKDVSIEERFACSREKCHTEAAKAAHEKRFRQALWLREHILGGAYETAQG
jgi:putative nucleotidyltransferase with HDIG domain